jgi:hypothetical protein
MNHAFAGRLLALRRAKERRAAADLCAAEQDAAHAERGAEEACRALHAHIEARRAAASRTAARLAAVPIGGSDLFAAAAAALERSEARATVLLQSHAETAESAMQRRKEADIARREHATLLRMSERWDALHVQLRTRAAATDERKEELEAEEAALRRPSTSSRATTFGQAGGTEGTAQAPHSRNFPQADTSTARPSLP